MTTSPAIQILSHIGICVSDIGRSRRFYCEGLGFKEVAAFKVAGEVGKTMEIGGEIALDSVFVRRDGVSLELLDFETPRTQGEAKRRPMNQLGLTHLSLLVDDVDAVAARVRDFGGAVYPQTRDTTPAGDFIFCTDPDGVRVELMRLNAGAVPTGD